MSGSILRNTFHPSSASRSTFPSGRTQKGRHLEIALAKLPASPNRFFLVFPSGIFFIRTLTLLSAFTIVKLPDMPGFCRATSGYSCETPRIVGSFHLGFRVPQTFTGYS